MNHLKLILRFTYVPIISDAYTVGIRKWKLGLVNAMYKIYYYIIIYRFREPHLGNQKLIAYIDRLDL